MRAYIGEELGSLDNFAVRQVGEPDVGPGEILLSVEATALGFVDRLVMRGLYQAKPPVPFIPGGEIVGTVARTGEGVSRFDCGQRVACWQFGGGLADMAVVREEHAVSVPETLESAEAAALLLDYFTAYHGLFDRGRLKPGRTVLVTGASGGVGSAAVRLASAASAIVAGLASTDAKRAYVRAQGASLAIDYREDGWRETLKRHHPDGIDLVFDPVGGDLFQLAFRSLAKRGRHLVVGFAAGTGIPSLPANLPLLKSGELVGVDARYVWENSPARMRAILSIIMAMAASGLVGSNVARRFALADARSALDFVVDPGRLGKVVVTP